ncbi:hypothetical protein [Litoribacter populi]|uniref:hypothetical protein n=1 Tax=Litoribacter populi TaxID=2598460 RepID=UPI00117F708A|nr:hypothetical protein [Litoribacter populi]
MKQVFLLCAAAGMLLFTSCNSDEEITINQDELLGEWVLQSIHYTTESTLDVQGQTLNSNSVVTGKDIDSGAAFHSNPNEFNTWGSYVARMEVWSHGEDPSEEGRISEMEMPPFLNGGAYELRNGNILRVFGPDGEEYEDYRVEMTDQLLVLHIDMITETDYAGVPQQNKLEGQLTYTR